MTAIVAGILALFMIVGGIIPMFSNHSLEDSLKTAFNNPEKLEVKVYSVPSYKILAGRFDRIEIDAKKPNFGGLQFDSMKIVTSPILVNYSKTANPGAADFIKEGKVEAMLVLSPESLLKTLDIQAITTKLNDFLTNFNIPVPMLSGGGVSVNDVSISFVNNQPVLSGNFVALGGMFSAPFTLSGQLIATAKNTVEIYKPQISVFGEPLLFDQLQDMVKFINPIIDLNRFSTPNMSLQLKRLYFKDNRLKIIGMVSFKNQE
jgi:hypothetical protein